MDDLLTLREAGVVIGISRWAVSLAIRGGTLDAEEHGPYLLVRRAEAERYRERSHSDPDLRRRNPKYRTLPAPPVAAEESLPGEESKPTI